MERVVRAAVVCLLVGCGFDSSSSGGAGLGTTGEGVDETSVGPVSGSPGAGPGSSSANPTTDPTEDSSDSDSDSESNETSATTTVSMTTTGADLWAAQRRIEIDAEVADWEVTQVPVLVQLTPERIEYELMHEDGRDLRFFTTDEQTPLPFEVEVWEPGGTSVVWVLLETTADGAFLMRYGNADAGPAEDAAAVWAEYTAVWHFNDPLDTPASLVTDASTNGHDGTLEGGIGPATVVAGVAGDGLAFDATSVQYVSVADAAALAPEELTLEFWIELSSTPADAYRGAIHKSGSYSVWALRNSANVSNATDPRFSVEFGAGAGVVGPDSDLFPGWMFVTCTLDVQNEVARFYVDGVSEAERTTEGLGGVSPSTNVLEIGRRLPGALDEVRIANVPRGGRWVSTQYRSMTDTLLTYGPPR